MTFGGDMNWGSTRAESTAIIDRYLSLGGNFIDTANLNTQGRSETILGEHLADRRDRLVLATKFSGNLHPDDPNGGGSNRKSVIAACEASLRRLKTDYIDLYWLHNWDKHTPIEETMATLHTLVASGITPWSPLCGGPPQREVHASERGLVEVRSRRLRHASPRRAALRHR